MDVIYKLPKENGGASAEGCIRYDQEQTLTEEQQQQAKDNLGIEDPEQVQADWEETNSEDPSFIKNKPTIPTVNNPTVTIKQGGTTKGTFNLNQDSAATINLDAGGAETVTRSLAYDYYLDDHPEVFNDLYNAFRNGKIARLYYGDSEQITYMAVAIFTGNDYNSIYFYSEKDSLEIRRDLWEYTYQIIHHRFIAEAPYDGKQYARKNKGWVEVQGGGEAVQSDWNETDTDDPAFIKNKPTIPTVNNPTVTIKQGGTTKGTFTLNQGSAATIDLEAGGGEAVQSDWNETDSDDPAFIKNKPTIPQPENHQVLTDAPESDISCSAGTKTQLCSLTIPEDGVYQISAAAVRVKVGSTQPNAMVDLELVFSDESESLPVASQFLYDRAGCIGIAAKLHRNTTVKLFATCGEACTISRTTDKQRLTYLNAVRIGAIYSE